MSFEEDVRPGVYKMIKNPKLNDQIHDIVLIDWKINVDEVDYISSIFKFTVSWAVNQ